MIKVLSIGNSFSVDAHFYLHDLSLCGEEEIYTVNLPIGGCPLEKHYNNMLSGEAAYRYSINGKGTDVAVSIEDGLKLDKWDYITIQQVSHLSGVEETYHPYIEALISYIKERSDAEILIQETWAYEIDSTHGGFARYDNNQDIMYERVSATYRKMSELFGIRLIPTGDVIQALRKTPEFDYKAGQPSLNRDGFHLSMDYGRYAAAAIWYKTLTGKKMANNSFVPYMIEINNDSLKKIKRIKEVVDSI